MLKQKADGLFFLYRNNKALAEYAAGYLSADLYEIVAETPYSSADLNYNKSDSRANKEQDDSSVRPAISGKEEGKASVSG